jgi:hypothetical protein
MLLATEIHRYIFEVQWCPIYIASFSNTTLQILMTVLVKSCAENTFEITLLKERLKGHKDLEEEVSSCRIVLRRKQDNGSARYHHLEN